MTPERDEESGKYVEEYPVEDFLEILDSEDGVTTDEIAQEIGCTYNLAYKKLKRLESDDEVTSETVGNSLVWYLA